MKITYVVVGQVSRDTNGPPGYFWAELFWDAVHCDPTQNGPYHPTPVPPVWPGQCLA